MIRGDVRRLPNGYRVVVLSSDTINDVTGRPWCAPIVRRADVPPELAGLAVPTHETDPVTGVVLLLETGPISRDRLSESTGMLVGTTLSRLEDGLRGLFDL